MLQDAGQDSYFDKFIIAWRRIENASKSHTIISFYEDGLIKPLCMKGELLHLHMGMEFKAESWFLRAIEVAKEKKGAARHHQPVPIVAKVRHAGDGMNTAFRDLQLVH